ncbi:MAG: segregation/condensation protein A [Bacteroidota bacterium]
MYRVQLQNFEGPLDLLLFFIRRDELDIHDIPVARITDEYLAYVRVLEEIDLDGVGDFVYMAAILISIKAKLLLPRPDLDDEGDPIDPRAELVQRLLEYMRYKEAAGHLGRRFEERGEQFVRGAAADVQVHAEEESEPSYRVSVFDLISVLKRVLAQAPDEAFIHPVQRYEHTMEEQQAFVLDRIRSGRTAFTTLVAQRSKPFIITTFLAILELVQRHALRIVDGIADEDFWLAPGERPAVHDSLEAAVSLKREDV